MDERSKGRLPLALLTQAEQEAQRRTAAKHGQRRKICEMGKKRFCEEGKASLAGATARCWCWSPGGKQPPGDPA